MNPPTAEIALPFPFAKADYPLAPITRYRIGGPARLALLPRTAEECAAAFAWMQSQPGRKLVLGGGTNVLIDDRGIDGIVLITTGLQWLDAIGPHRYRIGAGTELWDVVARVMVPNNYEGVGGLTGIPGSVGGAIYMNAGTVNGSTCQFMESVDVLNHGGAQTIAMRPELYDYRGQSFCAPGEVILGGIFRFAVAAEDQRPIHERYLQRRKDTQPPGHSCGSVFKNPPGHHSGRLIEACGLKGTRCGGAVISQLHANFIVNEDNASFDDVLALIALAKETVLREHGIALEEEVRIIRAGA